MTDMSVRVTCLDQPGFPIKGRLANLSAHGFSLILGAEFPPGSIFKVEWNNARFIGAVIYCQPRGEEFLLGLHVEDPVYDATISLQSEKNLPLKPRGGLGPPD